MTNRYTTKSFPMSLRWTAYVASKPPRGLRNQKWPFFVQKWISLEESLVQSFVTWKLSAAKL